MKKLLLASVIALSAPAAFAQVVVVGNGDAQLCYQSAKTGNTGSASAIRTCSDALEDRSLSKRDQAATFVNRGVLLMRGERHDEAEADYREALQINERLPEAHINLGVALFHQGRFEESISAYDTALGLKGLEGDADLTAMTLFNRALVHERLGNTREAYYDFREASRLLPDWEMAQDALTRFTVTRRSSS